MRVIYSVSNGKKEDMFEVISDISFARMVEYDVIELQLSCKTNDNNDIVYIELKDEETTRRILYKLFESDKVDLTGEYTQVHYTDYSYYNDEECEDLKERLENDDWADEEEDEDEDEEDGWEDEDNGESVDEDIIAEGYHDYYGQSSGVISKSFGSNNDSNENFRFGSLPSSEVDKKNDLDNTKSGKKKFSLFGKKGKYDL